MKKIQGPDTDPRRRQPGEIVAACRDGNIRIGGAEVGAPAELVARLVPQSVPGIIDIVA